jgi:hypothetical protein
MQTLGSLKSRGDSWMIKTRNCWADVKKAKQGDAVLTGGDAGGF